MSKRILYTAAAAALLAAGPVSATALEGVIVTGVRDPGGIDPARLGSSVTVISTQQMAERQIRTVADALRDAPGFAVSGALTGPTQVRVRGAEANHVLTLIDGVEAADPFLGEFDYATLLADEAARVEIVRGPQSALYGSDAVTGVVHYVTPSAAEAPGARMRVEFGTRGGFGGAARYGQAAGPLDVVLNGGVQYTDGYVAQTLPGGRWKVGSKQKTASAKAAYRPNETLSLRGVLRYTDTRAETDASVWGLGIVDAPGAYYHARALYYLAGADLRLMDGAWLHSLTVQGMDADRDSYEAAGRTGGDDGRRAKVSYVTALRLETGGATHRLTGAADWEKETFQNTSPLSAGADTTRRSIENLGLVAEYELQVVDMAGLGAAVRHDSNDAFADATTWKVQGHYRLGETLRLRAAAGTGIKNPSQTELYGYNATGPFPFVGNPNLKPETSRGWEAGVDLTLWDGRARLAATYFQASLRDEIFSASRNAAQTLNSPGCPVPAAGFTTTCNRASRSRQQGVELSGELAITGELSVSGSYTYLQARENGHEEIRRAPHIGAIHVTWRPMQGRASVQLDVRYNGRQLDSDFSGLAFPLPAGLPKVKQASDAGKVVLPAYALVNLAGSYALADHVEVFGRIENLMDEDYYDVFPYPNAPRTAYVGARLRF